jgi:hypothetical protein
MVSQQASHRLPQILLWTVAVSLTAYWIAYLGGMRLSRGMECSRELQVSQIPSNAWMILCCALGAIGLQRQRRWGLLLMVAAASALIFLGLFDITFNVRAGTYTALPWLELAPELLANALCTLFPAYLFWVALRAPAWD